MKTPANRDGHRWTIVWRSPSPPPHKIKDLGCGLAAVTNAEYIRDPVGILMARILMPEVIADGEKIADAVLDKVKHFTIGFARAGETPAAKGSGVLIKHGERHGILTCAHVDKYLRDLKRPVGLVRLNRGLAQQSATLQMDEVFSYAAGEAPWRRRRHRLYSPSAASSRQH